MLAHLDFPRRYWPRGAHLFREQPFEEEYRAVLRALAATGRVLEINTKTPLASVDLVNWWREEGGTAVSFGSDAHLPNRVGDRFKLAVDVVEAAGLPPGPRPVRLLARLAARRYLRNLTIALSRARAICCWNVGDVSSFASAAFFMLPTSMRIFGTLVRFRPARSSR